MDAEMTVSEAADRLGTTPSQVRRYIVAGRLPARRVTGRLYLLPPGALDDFSRPPRGRPRKSESTGASADAAGA